MMNEWGAYRITVILNSGHAVHTGLLEADEWALSLLVVTPCI